MVRVYRSISEYLRDITKVSSDTLGWKSLRVCVAADKSNCVKFTRLKRNTIKVTLSGTARHSVRSADLYDARPTQAGDAMLMPAGFSAELSWVTLGAVEQTIVVEFDDDFFETYCAETVTERLQVGTCADRLLEQSRGGRTDPDARARTRRVNPSWSAIRRDGNSTVSS